MKIHKRKIKFAAIFFVCWFAGAEGNIFPKGAFSPWVTDPVICPILELL